MRFEEINPFVRYAGEITPASVDYSVCSYDSRLFYILGGMGEIETNGARHVIKKGTLVMFFAGTQYRFVSAKSLRMYALNFDFTRQSTDITNSLSTVRMEEFDRICLTEQVAFDDCDFAENTFVSENAAKYEDEISAIVREFVKRRVQYGLVCGGMMKSLLGKLARSAVFEEKHTPEKLDTIIEYIQTHYTENITNDELGRLIGYHPYYINRLMMAYTGTTLRHYVINCRINEAKRLLMTSEVSLSEVAEKSGFKSAYYFSRCFKEKTGFSPGKFWAARKNMV